MYVIKRSDQGGGYVAIEGSKHSYTKTLNNAQIYSQSKNAERNCCNNEYVLSVHDILKRSMK